MKKLLFIALMAPSLAWLTSCQKEEITNPADGQVPEAAFDHPGIGNSCPTGISGNLVLSDGTSDFGNVVVEMTSIPQGYRFNATSDNIAGKQWLMYEVAIFIGNHADAPKYPDGSINPHAFPIFFDIIGNNVFSADVPATFPGCYDLLFWTEIVTYNFDGSVSDEREVWMSGTSTGNGGFYTNHCGNGCVTVSDDCENVWQDDGPCYSIGLDVTGGTPPYTYLWSNGSTSANPSVCGAVPGTNNYFVTVTDASGGTGVGTFNVNVNVFPTCGMSGEKVLLCHRPPGNPDGSEQCKSMPAYNNILTAVGGLTGFNIGASNYTLGPCNSPAVFCE